MEELAKLEAERGTPGYVSADGKRVASNEMCTFLILNISSLQLIPVNMIAYRQQYGSVNPAGIIAPAIVATFVSTAVAVVYCKMKDGNRRV
jgi:spore maturation protein A